MPEIGTRASAAFCGSCVRSFQALPLLLMAFLLVALALCANPAPAFADGEAGADVWPRVTIEDDAAGAGECRLVALIRSDNVMHIRNYEEADAVTFGELCGEGCSGFAGTGDGDTDGERCGEVDAPTSSGATGEGAGDGDGAGDGAGVGADDVVAGDGGACVGGEVVGADGAAANGAAASSTGEADSVYNTCPQVLAMYAIGDGSFTSGRAPWYERRGAIQCVTFGERVQPRSMALWFAGLDQLKRIEFGSLDTSRVCDMRQLFSECRSLDALDVARFDTSCVTCMARMFAGCSSLTALDVSSFDTRKVTDMSGMFAGCSGLTALDLSQFATESLKEADGMFEGCSNLAALDVSSFTKTQLNDAAIPVDNPGGFWKMNVPAGYDAGVKLREPNAAERAAVGVSAGGQDGASGGESASGGKDGQATASTSAAASTTSATVATVAAAAATLATSSAGSATGETQSSSAAAVGASEAPSVFTVGALAVGALSRFATGVVEPLAQLALDPSVGVADASDAAASILDALGIGGAVDKTMAMVAAAIGMLVAAGLVLTLCMKIR